ncbi:hypothetical protein BDN71DRAFT_1162979 [Pleurotus eryngii]|uniref:Uncharacterized protein n=1 Tax=Pleurotus eryngii TaxID=5323 RepID=A0A9P5ZTL0_PLEER|nr:hypothetical protein BDN71DRAFT_1162979 [Pleurotus eryngii]
MWLSNELMLVRRSLRTHPLRRQSTKLISSAVWLLHDRSTRTLGCRSNFLYSRGGDAEEVLRWSVVIISMASGGDRDQIQASCSLWAPRRGVECWSTADTGVPPRQLTDRRPFLTRRAICSAGTKEKICKERRRLDIEGLNSGAANMKMFVRTCHAIFHRTISLG